MTAWILIFLVSAISASWRFFAEKRWDLDMTFIALIAASQLMVEVMT